MANIVLKDSSGTPITYNNVETLRVPTTTSGVDAVFTEGTSKPEQEKTTDPSTSAVVVTPDEGYTLSQVTVNAMPAGTAGTPIATKGIISNNSVQVTPRVSNTTGYITGSTINGTAVTVSASELVSGNINLTNTTSTDVTNYATAQIVDANLTAENIAKDIVVLGITGTHEGGTNPETVSTVAELEAKAIAANENKIYKYTGSTSGDYTSGNIYEVVEEEILYPTLLTITGDWTNTQYVSTAVDYTGLTFTATMSDSTTKQVTPTSLNPTTWSSTAGTQTCTFSYTENEVTVTAQKSASVQEEIITAYKFYTQDYTQISDISISGLANAYWYTYNDGSYQRVGGRIFYINSDVVEGTNDKFYVYDSTSGLVTDKQWGKYETSIGVTSDGIGLGKTNTATCLAQSDWESDSIFTYVQSVNTAQIGGCNDWFIGSEAELDKLRSSGLVNWYSSNNIWSSVEYSSNFAYCWRYYYSNWLNYDKNYKRCVIPLRAF